MPEDIAVCSVDDAPGSAYSTPSLTSVSHRIDETCRAVAASLMSLVKGEDYDSSISLDCALIKRESSEIAR